MADETAPGERFDSWKSIASYLGRDTRTAIRWEKLRGLPVHRVPGGNRQGVFAYRRELDAWLTGATRANGLEPPTVDGGGASQTPAIPLPPPQLEILSAHAKVLTTLWRRTIYSAAGVVALLALLAAAYKYGDTRLSFRSPQLFDPRQLTENGQEKLGLLANGKNLYFGQEQDGWLALAEMPLEGGPVRVLWSPRANVLPVDISPDGKRLLALTFVGVETERSLWVVPLDGGAPYQPAHLTAHSAAWAPDSSTFAFAALGKISLLREDGTGQQQIGSFSATADLLHWSGDGKRLYFVLEDNSTRQVTHWELDFENGTKGASLRSVSSSIESYSYWSRAGGGDSYFLTSSTWWKPKIWYVEHGRHWWQPSIQSSESSLGEGIVSGIAYDKGSSRLFLLQEPTFRMTISRFDVHDRDFRPILPGVSGEFLDFSRDGKWAAYTTIRDNTVWIIRTDGTDARQLTFPPEAAELPRWSPDGKQLAFSSRAPNRPWRIFIIRPDTGERREASEGNDNQGAPTWSPDGKSLVYGKLKCQATNECAIRRIDLSTGKAQTLPGSEGLFTARWSPDGRWIAALHLERHQAFLFDVQSRLWHKLADSIEGTDMSWSPDSKSIYIDIPGGDARIVRIGVVDGHQETALDISAQDKFNLANDADLRFSIAPDGSIILPRRIHSPEVYAYDLRDR